MKFLDQELYDLITRGIQKGRKCKQPVLISHAVPMGTVDPLCFFVSAEQQSEEKIVYWSDTKEKIVLVGVGSAYAIAVHDNHANRFAKVAAEWTAILSNRLQSSLCDGSRLGPLLMGGGAFDPLQLPAEKWRQFANAEFTIPQLMLTQDQNGSWLTINYVLYGNEEARTVTEQLVTHCEGLLPADHQQYLATVQASFTVEEGDVASWMESVKNVVHTIREGKLKKVVLARELVIHSGKTLAVAQILYRLHQEQADTYIFAFVHQGDCLLGASPERIIKRAGECYYSTCLAGSIERGGSQAEDELLGQQLLDDSKNQLEHKIVVQMIGDKLEKYCETLIIPAHPVLLKLKNIQHLYTPLTGKARDKTSLLAVLDDLHPTPALGGAPQREAIKKIGEVERIKRGWYGGPVGWLDSKGSGEFAVAIRCGLIHQRGMSLFAGCGIVGNSDPQSEYEETKVKFQPMLSALGGA
jgi:menaquinone-specific isochorismate synthase